MDKQNNEDDKISSSVVSRLEHIEQKLDVISARTNIANMGFLSQQADDEIDLRELWNVIWAGKWIIIAITFVFALGSVIYALSLPNIYKSEALLAPADENSGGGLAGLAGQFGGLASLAGVNIGGGGNDKTALAIEVLKSREFITKFIDKHHLLVPLMATEGWDPENDQLIIDADVYDVKQERWTREPKHRVGSKPTMQEAYERFRDLMGISQDKKTNFVTLSMKHYSPSVAKSWVDLLIKDINEEIKARDVAEAKLSVGYLQEQLEKTAIADMQSIFYELIEEQSKIIMFSEVRNEYVFKTIDRAVVPESKTEPTRALICFLGVLLGGMISVFFVLIRCFAKNSNRKMV